MENQEIKDFVVRIGKRVKELRHERNMTQLDLCTKIGVEETTIQRLENARTFPTLKTLYKVAQGLEVEFKELF